MLAGTYPAEEALMSSDQAVTTAQHPSEDERAEEHFDAVRADAERRFTLLFGLDELDGRHGRYGPAVLLSL